MIGQSFEDILTQKRIENQSIKIEVVPNKEIEKKGFSNGCVITIIEDTELKGVEIFIAEELDEIDKIKILFHELGHAKDYVNRQTELETNLANTKSFIEKSEFFAFENSLIEALELYKNGRKDILMSLITIIPTRINEKTYSYGVNKIMKEKIWKECLDIINKKP